jgi:putative SOS response-associated peptidase YedK
MPPTCAIITTDANELLAPIHPRMPVILDPDDEVLWLDPGPIGPVKVLPCLRPFPSERMEAIPVSSLVSSPDNEGPELIEPVPAWTRDDSTGKQN